MITCPTAQGCPFGTETLEAPSSCYSVLFLMGQFFGQVPKVSSTPFSDCNLAHVFLHQVPSSPFFCPVPISWVHSDAEQASVSAPRSSSGFIFPHHLLPASLPSSSSHLSGSFQPLQVANMKLLRAQPQTPSLSRIPHSLKMKTPQGRTNYKSTLYRAGAEQLSVD